MKVLREWTIDAPWGKIALVSWGCEAGEPVLLVHGRQDSAATFEPLLQLLPDTFHYVALDLPGHGRSDPYPKGVMISRLHFVGAVQSVLRHLKWKEFVYIGHSMGCEAGLFFNAVYPHRVTRLVLLDPGPGLARLQIHDPQEYFASFYQKYYDNYHTADERRVYSKRRALESVMKARGFTERQAELALARNLEPAGEGLYRLSWDQRLKYLAPTNYPTDYYYHIFRAHCPPTLLIAAQHAQGGYAKGKAATHQLIQDLETHCRNFKVASVPGSHDVHFTEPERVAGAVAEFLGQTFGKSKL